MVRAALDPGVTRSQQSPHKLGHCDPSASGLTVSSSRNVESEAELGSVERHESQATPGDLDSTLSKTHTEASWVIMGSGGRGLQACFISDTPWLIRVTPQRRHSLLVLPGAWVGPRDVGA